MIEILVSAAFAVLSLAGIAFIFTQGQLATVDGLFFSGILALLATVFGGNAAQLLSARRKSRAAPTTTSAAKPTTAPESATASPAPAQSVASSGTGAAAAKPAPQKVVDQPQPAPIPTALPKPRPAPKPPAITEEQHGLTTGALLVHEHIDLPGGIAVEGKPFLPGWVLIERPEATALKRRIEQSGWHVFYLPAEPDAAALGISREQAEQRALTQLLPQAGNRNAFEITRKRAHRILGLWHVSLGGHARQIQQSQFLFDQQPPVAAILTMDLPHPERDKEQIRVA